MPTTFELGSRARLAALAVWLAAAAGAVASLLDGVNAAVGLLALAAAAAASILLAEARLGLGIDFVLVLGVATWLLFAGASPTTILAVAACVLLSGVAPLAARSRAGSSAGRGNAPPEGTRAADSRLPPGVADEELFDRLTIHEMTRARRYERPLTLLLVGVEGWSTLVADRGRRAAVDLLSTLAVKSRRLLRDVDALGIHGEGRLAILLPETPLDGALAVAGRIERLALEDVGLKLRVGASVFPDDAVTVEGLLQEADAALDLARLEHLDVAERTRLHS
jgi:GGDEF domain-containing protein